MDMGPGAGLEEDAIGITLLRNRRMGFQQDDYPPRQIDVVIIHHMQWHYEVAVFGPVKGPLRAQSYFGDIRRRKRSHDDLLCPVASERVMNKAPCTTSQGKIQLAFTKGDTRWRGVAFATQAPALYSLWRTW